MLTKLKKMYAGIFMLEKTSTEVKRNALTETGKKTMHMHQLLYHRDFKVSQRHNCQQQEHEFWIN